MKLTKILGSPIAFHRCLAELAGSVTSGLMLSQAVYWTGKTKDPHGWFWKTQDEWYEETMLTRKEQESARRRLRELNFEGESLWQEQLRGVPAKLYYRVDMAILECLLTADQYDQNVPSSMSNLGILESPNGANKQAQKGHAFLLTEITSEITSETTTEREPHTPQTDVWAIALEHLPTLGIWQQDAVAAAGITKLHLWRQACHNWATNRYSARNITGLIDSYYRLEKQDNREREYQNGQNGQHRRETHNQRAARQTYELIASLRGEDGGNDSADPAHSVFELPASFR